MVLSDFSGTQLTYVLHLCARPSVITWMVCYDDNVIITDNIIFKLCDHTPLGHHQHSARHIVIIIA